MKYLKLFCVTILLGIFSSCTAQKNLNQLDVLLGVWKIENKETYETWEKNTSIEFQGQSYKNVNGTKHVSETLTLKILNDKIVYGATVSNQNGGKTIYFELNNSNEDLISFENETHDFPKKIQYKVINKNKLLVNVLGENNQGFSYYLIKQE